MRHLATQIYGSVLHAQRMFPSNADQIHMRLQGPKVLINSLPKSGTNLLVRCISLFPGMIDRRQHINNSDGDSVFHALRSIRKGQFATAHLFHDRHLVDHLQRHRLRSIFILRDPRDVAVSAVKYLMEINKDHVFSKYLRSLPDNHTRLKAIICGSDEFQGDVRIKGVSEQLPLFTPWLQEESICNVRYEELIGATGQGDFMTQLETVKRIADYLEIEQSLSEIEYIAQNTFWKGAVTFRKGKIGGWQDHFSARHKALFKEQAGQYLIDLGYEQDFDW